MKRTTITNALICAVVSMSIISCENSKVYDVRLSGEGVDLFPDSSRVLVFHKGADIRFEDPVASVRLDGGTFNMSFQDSVVRQYELIFEEDMMDGQIQVFNFFSDRAPLHFSFGSRYGKLTVEVAGSRDNEELYLYRNKSTEAYELVDSMYYEIDRWLLARYGEDEPVTARTTGRRKARRIIGRSWPCMTEPEQCGTVSMFNPAMMSGRGTDLCPTGHWPGCPQSHPR